MPYLFNNGTIAMQCTGGEWTIGKPYKNKKGDDKVTGGCYCYKPDHAVKTLARKVADHEAEELFEWLEIYAEVNEEMKKALGGAK